MRRRLRSHWAGGRTPLRNAQRAIRFVRARAAEFGVIPDRIGMMGFSAGVLSYCPALKLEPAQCANVDRYSPDAHVTAQVPPAFICHTTDDDVVTAETSVTFYRALAKAGVPVEMHLFAKGRHRSGLASSSASRSATGSLRAPARRIAH